MQLLSVNMLKCNYLNLSIPKTLIFPLTLMVWLLEIEKLVINVVSIGMYAVVEVY